jgi:glycosyltransferase involved in cell wall biosynthesis
MFLSNPPTTAPHTNSMQRCFAVLARLYERHDTMDALLHAAAQIAAEILAVEYCGIAWVEDDRTTFRVRASFSANGANGHAEHANRLVAAMIHENGHPMPANHGNGIGNELSDDSNKKNALVAPLRVNEKVVGYLFAANGEKCTTADESLLAALGEHIGRAIEMQSMRQMLTSSYLAKTLNPDTKISVAEQNLLESHILAAVEHPEKVAKLLARTFYRDLRKAGFETNQILMAATELIDNMNEALQKTRAKSDMPAISGSGNPTIRKKLLVSGFHESPGLKAHGLYPDDCVRRISANPDTTINPTIRKKLFVSGFHESSGLKAHGLYPGDSANPDTTIKSLRGSNFKAIKVAHIATVDLSLRHLLLNQMRSIQQAGFEVCGISAPGPDVPVIEAAGVRHFPVAMTRNFTPFADLKALWKICRILKRERFTIVHTHTPKPGLLGQLAARMAGVPIVVNTIHGFYFHDQMPARWRRFYILLEKIAARCSDFILSQNREDIQTAVREGICHPENIGHLGNGIDVVRFDRARLNPDLLQQKRRELGLPEGAPVVGFVGRLVAEKGIIELFKAVAIARQRIPALRLLLVGEVDHVKADALQPSLAAEYGLADACVFAGWQQDMPEMYALMDVFVLPSHREGFPRAPMEASAMEVPCIVTDIRGCREAVEQNRNGVLVPLGNVQTLAEAIIDLLMNPAKAGRMAQAGRQKALERFDERLVFEKVKNEYKRLLRAKGFAAEVAPSYLSMNVNDAL